MEIKELRINIIQNIKYIYIVALVYSFGIYGAGGRISIIYDLILIFIISITIILSYNYKKEIKRLDYTERDLIKIMFIMITILIIQIKDLDLELSGDPFSHIFVSYQPSIEILKMMVRTNLIDENYRTIDLLNIINISIFLTTIVIFYKIKSIKKKIV